MLRLLLSTLALTSSVTAECTRQSLKEAATAYLTAQTAGTASKMSALSSSVAYVQNDVSTAITSGVLSTAIAIDHNRSTYDTTQCATYTEIVSTDAKHPYVIGTQIRYDNSSLKINKIETVVTEKGDWLWDPANTLKYVKQEDGLWDEIPEAKRDSRAVIQAAGDAYLNLFNDKSTKVPWGFPCERLEGGAYTGKGSADDTCNVGVPSGVKIDNRRYVVDEVLGTVDVMCTFAGIADTHEFRVEGGKLRFVHTMTNTGK